MIMTHMSAFGVMAPECSKMHMENYIIVLIVMVREENNIINKFQKLGESHKTTRFSYASYVNIP